MITITDLNGIVALATAQGIVNAITESAQVAQINPALLPAPTVANGRISYRGNGWVLNLAAGANPAALTGAIHTLEGSKRQPDGTDKPWKMLIIR